MTRELVVATKNKKKLKEIKQIFKRLPLKITSLADYPDSPRIIENGSTFGANAAIKALKISKFTKKLTLGEDSGLEVRALGNRPGVYSSRFAGRGKSDEKNNREVLRLLNQLPLAKRQARYRCSVALASRRLLQRSDWFRAKRQVRFWLRPFIYYKKIQEDLCATRAARKTQDQPPFSRPLQGQKIHPYLFEKKPLISLNFAFSRREI